MNKAKVIGLTGPMGSGKTIVAGVFSDFSYKVIDADVYARKVVEKGSKTLADLASVFGEDIICDDGTLNRRLLAQRAFVSKENTDKLNAITHPAILKLVESKIKEYTDKGYTKIVYDAPLLFESGSDKLCEKVVSVIAFEDDRMKRVVRRDKLTQSEIQRRFSAQHSDRFYTEKSDFVIINDSSIEELILKTRKVIDAIEKV
ncbi:MAG: dephospho-CoA kinase [Ruminococcaceae bacterium]|nr:dephospho-CoA kinase [Oscillospiraceae bacterium]